MRKIFSLLLTAVLFMTAVFPVAAADTMTVSLRFPELSPAVGESFTVQASVSDNPGFCALKLVLDYDNTKLLCKTVEAGTLTSEMLFTGNPEGAEGAVAAAASSLEIKGDGNAVNFIFEVLAPGTVSLNLKVSCFYDADGEMISASAVSVEGVLADRASESDQDQSGDAEEDAEERTGSYGGRSSRESEEKDSKSRKEDPDQPESSSSSEGELIAELFTPPEVPTFTDVPKTHWGYAFVERAAAVGLVSGMGNGLYAPDAEMTRAQFATILWKIYGRPVPGLTSGLSDIPAQTWYTDAVYWAVEQNLMDLTGEDCFLPSAPIVRQDIVTSFYRCCKGLSGAETLSRETYENTYVDHSLVAGYARDAMFWAVSNGIVSGTSAVNLSPLRTATRAQVATLFLHYIDFLRAHEASGQQG